MTGKVRTSGIYGVKYNIKNPPTVSNLQPFVLLLRARSGLTSGLFSFLYVNIIHIYFLCLKNVFCEAFHRVPSVLPLDCDDVTRWDLVSIILLELSPALILSITNEEVWLKSLAILVQYRHSCDYLFNVFLGKAENTGDQSVTEWGSSQSHRCYICLMRFFIQRPSSSCSQTLFQLNSYLSACNIITYIWLPLINDFML